MKTQVLRFPIERVDYRPRVLTEVRLYRFERRDDEQLPLSAYFAPLTWLMFGAIMWLAVRA